MSDYFLANAEGQPWGPFNFDQVADMVAQGTLKYSDRVWNSEWGSWKTVSELIPATDWLDTSFNLKPHLCRKCGNPTDKNRNVCASCSGQGFMKGLSGAPAEAIAIAAVFVILGWLGILSMFHSEATESGLFTGQSELSRVPGNVGWFLIFVIISLLLSLAGNFIYFLPSIVAFNRGYHQLQSLFVVNVFLGWTFLGWVACLAWSFAQVKDRK